MTDSLPTDQTSFSVVSGANSGAINAWGLSMFNVGDEKNATEYLKNVWLNLEAKHVYEEWGANSKIWYLHIYMCVYVLVFPHCVY